MEYESLNAIQQIVYVFSIGIGGGFIAGIIVMVFMGLYIIIFKPTGTTTSMGPR